MRLFRLSGILGLLIQFWSAIASQNSLASIRGKHSSWHHSTARRKPVTRPRASNPKESVAAERKEPPPRDEDPASFCNQYPTFHLPREAQKAYQNTLNSEKNRKGEAAMNMAIEVNGSRLTGAEFEVEGFKNILGEVPPKDWLQSINGCSTVLCALTRLFGSEESAQRVLVVYFYSGYAISLDQSAHQTTPERIFSVDEIRELDAGLRLVPPQLYRMINLKDVVTTDPKPGSSAWTTWASFDGSKYVPGRMFFPEQANYVVFLHEFGHQVDIMNLVGNETTDPSRVMSSQPDFRNLVWQDGSQQFIRRNSLAQKNPLEAFAEAFKHYILWPQILRATNPEGYEYFRNTFFIGKEYPETDTNCPPLNRFPKLEL
jgi:hypothetical protein